MRTKAKIGIFVFIGILLVSGCQKTTWIPPRGTPYLTALEEFHECENEAKMAGNVSMRQVPAAYAKQAGLSEKSKIQELCLRQKGYLPEAEYQAKQEIERNRLRSQKKKVNLLATGDGN